jgi:hypothetical protein
LEFAGTHGSCNVRLSGKKTRANET